MAKKKGKSLKFLFFLGFIVFLLVFILASILGIPANISFILAFIAAGFTVYLNSPDAD